MNQQDNTSMADASISRPDLSELFNQNINGNKFSFGDLSISPFSMASNPQRNLMDYCMDPNISSALLHPHASSLFNVSKYMHDPSVSSQTGYSMFSQFMNGQCSGLDAFRPYKPPQTSPSRYMPDGVSAENSQRDSQELNYCLFGLPTVSTCTSQSAVTFATQMRSECLQTAKQSPFHTDALDTDSCSQQRNLKLSSVDYCRSSALPDISNVIYSKVSCDICGRGFATSSYLQQHKRIHSGERPYECQHCGKKFTQMSHVKQHERVHTGERPYVCQICDKRFTQLSNLRSHQKGHHQPLRSSTSDQQYTKSPKQSGEHGVCVEDGNVSDSAASKLLILYPCKRCGQTFMNNAELVRHQDVTHRTNKGRPKGKSKSCDICGKQYISETLLFKHLSQRHPYSSASRGVPSSQSATDSTLHTESLTSSYDNSFRGRNIFNGAADSSDLTSNAGEQQQASSFLGLTSACGVTSNPPFSQFNLDFISNLHSNLNWQNDSLNIRDVSPTSSSCTDNFNLSHHMRQVKDVGVLLRPPSHASISVSAVTPHYNSVGNSSISFPTAMSAGFIGSVPNNAFNLFDGSCLGPHSSDTSSIVQNLTNCVQRHL